MYFDLREAANFFKITYASAVVREEHHRLSCRGSKLHFYERLNQSMPFRLLFQTSMPICASIRVGMGREPEDILQIGAFLAI
jgi:hypothetical protein